MEKECQVLIPKSCAKIHACSHLCRGFAGEQICLPCLEPECIEKASKQIVDISQAPIDGQTCSDYCSICFTGGLGQEPSVRLNCRHIFHLGCILKILNNKWLSPRIVFQFTFCPQCKSKKIDAPHCPEIHKIMTQNNAFEIEVKKKALERGKFEDLDKDPDLKDPSKDFKGDLQKFAMYKLAYY